MDAYHVALFLHIVTLIVAASATAVTKLAVSRRIRARTASEALDWHNTLISASRVFPFTLVSFVVTGGYMVSVMGARAWSSGFVVAGFVGVGLLLGSGTYLGVKGKALKRVLENAVAAAPGAAAPRLVPPAPVVLLPVINTGVALATVFDMVTKPASIPVALGVIAIGAVASVAIAKLQRSAAPRGEVRPSLASATGRS